MPTKQERLYEIAQRVRSEMSRFAQNQSGYSAADDLREYRELLWDEVEENLPGDGITYDFDSIKTVLDYAVPVGPITEAIRKHEMLKNIVAEVYDAFFYKAGLTNLNDVNAFTRHLEEVSLRMGQRFAGIVGGYYVSLFEGDRQNSPKQIDVYTQVKDFLEERGSTIVGCNLSQATSEEYRRIRKIAAQNTLENNRLISELVLEDIRLGNAYLDMEEAAAHAAEFAEFVEVPEVAAVRPASPAQAAAAVAASVDSGPHELSPEFAQRRFGVPYNSNSKASARAETPTFKSEESEDEELEWLSGFSSEKGVGSPRATSVNSKISSGKTTPELFKS